MSTRAEGRTVLIMIAAHAALSAGPVRCFARMRVPIGWCAARQNVKLGVRQQPLAADAWPPGP
jgi:hypothetical protein